MALVIPLNVAAANAIIFFLIDVPAAWAIQRGLLALQAVYLYKLARSGSNVPLARSRIPIVGGELLRGVTRWPSIFEVINIIVLVFLCLATLGVDAGEKARWERALFKNITTLDFPSSHEMNTSIFPDTVGGRFNVDKSGRRLNVAHALAFRDTVQENRTCRTRNATHADYWPVVFNATHAGPSKRSNAWFADNASCQANATGSSPMLTTSCVPIDELESCSLDAITTLLSVRIRFEDKSSRRLTRLSSGKQGNTFSREWNGTLEMESANVGKGGLAQLLKGSRIIQLRYINRKRRTFPFLLINQPSSGSWFFALARNNERISNTNEYIVSMAQPLRLTPHGTASVEYMLLALRTNIDVALYMQGVQFRRDYLAHNPFEFFESILLRIYRGVQSPTSQVAYIRKADQDVTCINLTATVLYGFIIALAIVLFPMKELLAFVFVRHGKLKAADLLVYEYDQLSRKIRALTERLRSAPPSGEFSLLEFSDAEEEEVEDEEGQEEKRA